MRGCNRGVCSVLAVLAFAFVIPAIAHAEMEFGLSGFAGYQTYTMSDLNDEVVKPINADLAGTGLSMDEISKGAGFGGGVRVRPHPDMLIAVEYQRLAASSELTVPAVGSLKLDAPANAFMGTFIYLVPSASRARFGVGGGLGYYHSSGKASFYDATAGTITEDTMDGNGFGFHAMGVADVLLSQQVHFEAGVGYRYAKSTDLKINGVKAITSSGDDAKLDWSGLLTRAGLAVYFGPK